MNANARRISEDLAFLQQLDSMAIVQLDCIEKVCGSRNKEAVLTRAAEVSLPSINTSQTHSYNFFLSDLYRRRGIHGSRKRPKHSQL